MVVFGVSASAIDKMWLYPDDVNGGFSPTISNPEQKSLARLTHDLHKMQLHPGQHQRLLSQRFQ